MGERGSGNGDQDSLNGASGRDGIWLRPPPLAGFDKGSDLTFLDEILDDNHDVDGTVKRYRDLYDLSAEMIAAARPEEVEPRQMRIHCGSVLVVLYCETGQLDSALAVFEDIAGQPASLFADPIARESLARAAKQLVFVLGDVDLIEPARQIYDSLVDLAGHYAQDEILALQQGEAAAALAVDYQQREDEDTLLGLCNDLSILASRFPEALDLHMWLGRCALGLIGLLTQQQRWGDAEQAAQSFRPILLSPEFAAHMRSEFSPAVADPHLDLIAALVEQKAPEAP